ncbi:sigma-70 family RNA polymerase sigma factor [Cytobacillus sp. FJAT-54145]|uniref:Sigma-70 family RNA polymerase sigma factor n=1 Tax=Cytobacillus spartinae TaxID=3299023 RepID=A0ABW6KFW7_9BACI
MSRENQIEQQIASTVDRSIALEIIMDEYGTTLKRLIYSYVKDWGIASDLTQEVFITVYEKLDTFQRRSSFKTWIFTIAVNRSKDYLKSWHHRNMVMNEKVFFFKKDTEKSPEAKMVEDAENSELLSIIWSLPVKYREVFLLHYYQDLSLQEIAETLKIPVSTVKTRLYRGQEKVKKLYSNVDRGEQHG